MDLGRTFERIFAGRWVAGPEIGDALQRTTELNKNNVGTILNYLGEELADKKLVDEAVRVYIDLIHRIAEQKLNAAISVKITQIGLSIDKDLAAANYKKILDEARTANVFTWLDMEGSKTTDPTLKLYLQNCRDGLAGIAIQSYLKRSYYDVERIVKANGIVRLVKGAYKEKPLIAYKKHKEINNNYERLMQYLYENSAKFTIATHDPKMLERALAMNEFYKKDVTFAMLNGIRNKYAFTIAKEHTVDLYVPFGRKWVDYSRRRLSEMSHAWLIFRSLF